MAIYPVIMCGGSGMRLWPASRPSRPKQFVRLAGDRSLFQETVRRVAPLAENGGRLIIVAGLTHRSWVAEQLQELNVIAHVLLEPEARDSAAAMAVAAAWTEREDVDGVNAFVASDHHIPDHAAFQDAIRVAAASAADGRIVTLGVKPIDPSSAYGYIKPSGRGLSRVEQFVEKPNATTATQYIAAGYLWNSGNFVVSARTLLSELRAHAPTIESAARRALPPRQGTDVAVLGEAFLEAPRISIDYGLLEKTSLASVLEVDFGWSDVGAWDAVAATGSGDMGVHLFEDADGCLVRSAEGMVVAAVGVRNLAIIAERDAVLVCDLSRAQDVKTVVERLRTASPRHLDFPVVAPTTLAEGARRFADWMRLRALPIWATLGQSSEGMFAEAISLDGRVVSTPRRARVQARQIYAYSQAGLLGWAGPWRRCVEQGLARLFSDYLREDGLSRTLLAANGSPLDERATVYDQAFALLALATAKAAGFEDSMLEARAVKIRDKLRAQSLPNGAFVEDDAEPYQSNCHIHLLEACLAWEEVVGDVGWADMADQIVFFAGSTLIDASGFVRKFFAPDWGLAPGEAGRFVEPGHQFQWAWLMAKYSRLRDDAEALDVARKLFFHGIRGVFRPLGLAVDETNDDGSIRSRRARLWPQTEWLKASLILAELSHGKDRSEYARSAAEAQRGLWRYLSEDGLWRDKALPDGSFAHEPAPASSLYHLMATFRQLSDTARAGEIDDLKILDLR